MKVSSKHSEKLPEPGPLTGPMSSPASAASAASAAPVAPVAMADLPRLIMGADTIVPTRTGTARYINFDNAASTPTFQPIAERVTSFLRWYSNVHRGTGFKSQLSSWAFEHARDMVAQFVGADLNRQVVIFCKNSTEAINKLSHRLGLDQDDIVLTSMMEHHSNELPWRRVARVEHIAVDTDGRFSLTDYQEKLRVFGKRVKLVAVTGASNVSGYINDLYAITSAAHAVGARVLIDGAQLVPHRPIQMTGSDPAGAVDFMVFSAHKMYAPFGVGVLVGDRKIFESGEPDAVGGGVVDIVNLEEAYWTDLPDKEEAGTPDIVGVVALGAAIALFNQLGWEAIIHHEEVLTRYALEQLKTVPKIVHYGDPDPARARERLGVISFNVSGLPHTLTSAILSHEYGIGVRSGCFCAHLYVRELMKCTDERAKKMEDDIKKRDRSDIPGAVRISFGLYNTTVEIDILIAALRKIAAGEYAQDYCLDVESGEYQPPNFAPRFEEFFSFG